MLPCQITPSVVFYFPFSGHSCIFLLEYVRSLVEYLLVRIVPQSKRGQKSQWPHLQKHKHRSLISPSRDPTNKMFHSLFATPSQPLFSLPSNYSSCLSLSIFLSFLILTCSPCHQVTRVVFL